MLDENDSTTASTSASTDPAAEPAPAAKKATRKAATKRTTAKKAATKKTAAGAADQPTLPVDEPAAAGDPGTGPDPGESGVETPAKKTAVKRTAAKRTTAKKAATKKATAEQPSTGDADPVASADPGEEAPEASPAAPSVTSPLFRAPDPVAVPTRRRATRSAAPAVAPTDDLETTGPSEDASAGPSGSAGRADRSGRPADSAEANRSEDPGTEDSDTGSETSPETSSDTDTDTDSDDEQGGNRRRRRRGGRRRRRSAGDEDSSDGTGDDSDDDQQSGHSEDAQSDDSDGGSRQSGGRGSGQNGSGQRKNGQKESGQKRSGQGGSGQDRSGSDDQGGTDSQEEGTGSRRRRRRRRSGEEGDGTAEEQNTVTRVRKPRNAEDEITALHGSTRLEAKKQRRREGREAGRRRAPIVSEAEFLARREAVDRVMVIRQREDLTQIAVLEDKVLVEHYVARESQTSLIGNVYLGRVQNVLPSMEAAFIDIGKGRNAVLYAGEVNWDSLGAGNGPRKIEQVLKSGQPILVQVSKDPIGHKGARLTSQVSLPGRFLVYVPDGTTSGISRKLPDTERSRLKTLLKEIVPDSAGVIVRTAAEGASEEELTLDVERLTARWSDIESKVDKGNAPQLLYGEPDLTLKVVRDLFTEDFARLVVSGDDAWDMVDAYVKHVAPDLEERLERYSDDEDKDVFAAYRIDEQIAKGMDRKVWLPSGGSLVIDRTEAMTVVDVNTGKFTGSGGNLEETVTKNNLEAAEEMVRQLRLRDIGGIIVIDFIDMVLESNRDLVLRRLVECLGRDRTRHQVAEVTSLGLVQMTRKRIGTGLLEAFSESCEHCHGRGLVTHHEPVEANRKNQDEEPRRGRRGRSRGNEGGPLDDAPGSGNGSGNGGNRPAPSPKDLAAMAKHEPRPTDESVDEMADLSTDDVPEPSAAASTVEAYDDAPAADAGQSVATESATEPSAAESAGTEPSTAEPTRQAEQTRQAEPVAAPVPAGPVLVTSRRRVARRPAGPPSGTGAADPVTTSDGTSAGTEETE